MSKGLIVAIDGPAGSGKSSSAKMVAQKLGYLYIDTGAMYRAVTFLAIEENILNDELRITERAQQCKIVLKYIDGETKVILNDEEITNQIRSHQVNKHVSNVSRIKELRKILVNKQRELAKNSSGVVMEGRDIGTVVFPDAYVKFFLTASIEKRAERRSKEYEVNGIEIPVEEIRNNIELRDKIDSNRDDSPLLKADDAIEIDTTNVTIEEQVNLILNEVNKKLKIIKE